MTVKDESSQTRSDGQPGSAESTTSGPVRATRTRRKLSPAQQREVARLYGSTDTSVPDISSQFGIGESSVYRLVQLHGVALRGRGARSSAGKDKPAGAPAARRAGRPRRQSTASDSGNSNGRATSKPTSSATPSVSRYQISFASVQSMQARDMLDAIRQAEALGATEITSIERVA